MNAPTMMLAIPCDEAAVAEDCLESRMQRRLGSRVRNLRVLRLPAGLVIQGRAVTYYAKQLATHAAMELDETPILANEIEVL